MARLARTVALTAAVVLLTGAAAFGGWYAVQQLAADTDVHAANEDLADTDTGTADQPAAPAGEVDAPEALPQPRVVAATLLRPAYVAKPGDKGDTVRELQHRLFQLAWFPEATTGRFDDDTTAAVSGFQVKRGLPATGKVDTRTWRRLVSMTETPTSDQKNNIWHPGPVILGPGASGESVRDLQSRLVQIQWLFGDVSGSYDGTTAEAVRGFQDKRGIPVTGDVDQRTLDRLTAMTRTPTHEEKHNIRPDGSGDLDSRCLTGRVLCIDKSTNSLRWVVNGQTLMQMDARFGSTVNGTPTREGQFSVYLKSRDHVSSLYDSAMPFAMFFDGGQAVHYSSDFAAQGYSGASHGCVNIRDYGGIASLYDQVQIGDKVVVYWS